MAISWIELKILGREMCIDTANSLHDWAKKGIKSQQKGWWEKFEWRCDCGYKSPQILFKDLQKQSPNECPNSVIL